MATKFVRTCEQFQTLGDGSITCSQEQWTELYVIPPEMAAQLELVLTGGFDGETFLQFFSATIVLFIVGFGIGLVISQVRKVRRV
ncbi:MAG: hypothetical protein CML01_00510 [Pseudomonas sp.]|jgi:hypothetical protein|nr:hypothetical protein [Pseudomonas sp.]